MLSERTFALRQRVQPAQFNKEAAHVSQHETPFYLFATTAHIPFSNCCGLGSSFVASRRLVVRLFVCLALRCSLSWQTAAGLHLLLREDAQRFWLARRTDHEPQQARVTSVTRFCFSYPSPARFIIVTAIIIGMGSNVLNCYKHRKGIV